MARGVMLLPGVGFDVVPSDCLAAHLKRRLPDATHLKLYLSLGANMSRGTAKTMIEAHAFSPRQAPGYSRPSGARVMRLWQGRDVHGTGQLGRRLHRVSFDWHSQHRGSVRGVAGDPPHDTDACLHQIDPWPGLHANPSQGPGRPDARRSERGNTSSWTSGDRGGGAQQ
jgi:hypothetical protein